ncbi:EAL domain-containing protein [Nitratifractor salsuginis]|uniref:Diguanylate cyclase/phosphodiesterase n=1 Tax=Nitratifractor salsuginis (strain DSM 16511 / JCM 12458 / E9I37-1) TaxID=749222 RepID=E6WXR5_NITSE|nr:GGDEF domain-containing phosphodiesterase [Nitratifractor salsuginis]ADV46322.1 diguanylate cyclase/phosphodiesterase [Nitratifractor salsuginis DSM 16511]
MGSVRNLIEEDEIQSILKWISLKNRNFLETMLQKLISRTPDQDDIEKYGKELYKRLISFSRLPRLLETLGNRLPPKQREQLRQCSDRLAKGYLDARMPHEMDSLRRKVHSDSHWLSTEDLEVIEELFHWIDSLLQNLQGKGEVPGIAERMQEFAAFVDHRGSGYFADRDIREDFLRTNRELYQTAMETVALFARGEYYYGALIYIEMIALFLKMATLLNGMFLQEELMSVYLDPVTLLPNRFRLLKDIEDFHDAYILILNVNAFSKLNLLYGYDYGDDVLRRIAQTLRNSIAQKSYRIYGDEFAAIVGNEQEIREIFRMLNRSVSVLRDEKLFDIYFYGAYRELEDRALEICEFALQRNRGRELIDSKEIEKMIETLQSELALLQEFKEALDQDRVVPWYQPIYSTAEERIVAYEALMRIERDGIPPLEPGEFLTQLIDSPYYSKYTQTILRKSFERFRDAENFEFSVNFLPRDFRDEAVSHYLDKLVRKYPATASRMTIEIVESEALSDFEEINRFIRNFQPRGIRFALDDFGSGYSNFIQCVRLEIDMVKIDGSIVKHSLKEQKMGRLLHSVLEFSDSFGIKTAAEYVSSKALFESLKRRVDRMQGSYIGMPSPQLRSGTAGEGHGLSIRR